MLFFRRYGLIVANIARQVNIKTAASSPLNAREMWGRKVGNAIKKTLKQRKTHGKTIETGMLYNLSRATCTRVSLAHCF